MISEWAGPRVRQWMLRIGAVLARWGVSPNVLTVAGLILNVLVAMTIAMGHLQAGGVFLLFASAFDMLDGAVARANDQATPFGGFLDSTLDRYSEIIVFFGLLMYLLSTEDARPGSILIFLAITGSLMVSYARARAEAQGFKASGGILPRPERIVILAVAMIIGQPTWALWLLAALTHATAITRILQVWRVTAAATGTGKPAPATNSVNRS